MKDIFFNYIPYYSPSLYFKGGNAALMCEVPKSECGLCKNEMRPAINYINVRHCVCKKLSLCLLETNKGENVKREIHFSFYADMRTVGKKKEISNLFIIYEQPFI